MKRIIDHIKKAVIAGRKLFTIFIRILFVMNFSSCKLSSTIVTPSDTVKTKSVRYLATMVSSSSAANPSITYLDANGASVLNQVMSLDISQSMAIGAKANIICSCDGFYSPVVLKSSAAIDLKIYVNDTLKAQASDLKTDPFNQVTASATCSYTIK